MISKAEWARHLESAAHCLCFCLLAASSLAQAFVTEPSVERFDATHVIVTWRAAAPVDLLLSDSADGVSSEGKLLSGSNRDGHYEAAITAGQRPFFLLRDTSDGSIVRVAERVVSLERGSNFRDVGGYPAAGGKHVRWGLIYRSGATPLLSDHDIATLRKLGLGTMIDLRSSDERELAPTRMMGHGVRYVAIDYPLNGLPRNYLGFLAALAPQYRAIFDELLTKGAPISYNCTSGQDRTGIATALVLSALGVPRQFILDDFHLSTANRRPAFEVPVIDPAKYPDNPTAALLATVPSSKPQPLFTPAGRSRLGELFDQIDAKWGSVNGYLEQVLHIGPVEREKLRDAYLE